jgi:hypothetical protein
LADEAGPKSRKDLVADREAVEEEKLHLQDAGLAAAGEVSCSVRISLPS